MKLSSEVDGGSEILNHRASISATFVVGALACVLLSCLCPLGNAQDEETKSCLECHEGMAERFSGEFIHEPFEDEDCYACHIFHGFRQKTELKDRVIVFCTGCHEDVLDLPENEAHTPVSEEESCTLCHSPHRAEYPDLLLRPVKELCVDCHDSPSEATGEIHQPYADSACDKCHNPHGSVFPFHLQMPSGFICTACHLDFLAGYGPQDMHSGNDLNSCDNCHTGHSSSFSHLLRRQGSDLCLGCHTEMGDVSDRQWSHEAVTDGQCLDCHTPHFRKNGSSLLDTPSELCGGCHDLEDEKFSVAHLDLIPERCAGCHDPHGSSSGKLLLPYLHVPFEDRECNSCHEDGGDLRALRSPEICEVCHGEPETTGEHAADLVGKRVCVDCHSPHAGRAEYLLR